MFRRARRRDGASRWELQRAEEIEAARRADDERRARDREELRERALASARRHGATDHWRALWLVCGLGECELEAIRAQVTLEASS